MNTQGVQQVVLIKLRVHHWLTNVLPCRLVDVRDCGDDAFWSIRCDFLLLCSWHASRRLQRGTTAAPDNNSIIIIYFRSKYIIYVSYIDADISVHLFALLVITIIPKKFVLLVVTAKYLKLKVGPVNEKTNVD